MKIIYHYLRISTLLLLSIAAEAQLFIDDGTEGAVYLRDATGGTLGTSETDGSNTILYVDGDISIEGTLDNQAAEVVVTEDFTNDGTFITTGDEVLQGGNAQILGGTLSGANDFNNLILDKAASTLVNLASNIETASSGIIRFEDGGILATGSNYLHVKNTATNALLGMSTNGSLDKFVMGELRRNVTAGNTYLLPVGGTNVDSDGGDGMQSASIRPNAGSGVIAASFQDGTGTSIGEEVIVCGGTVDHKIGNGAWLITNPGGGITNYAITLDPADFTDIGYVDYTMLKDGVATGLDPCNGVATALPITHDGFTSFSTFEVAGSTDEPLPVELVSFQAKVTDQRVVVLTWQTASETNNAGFAVERSDDGVAWEVVTQREGAINSSTMLSYQATDSDPYSGVSYYRLKQIDLDGQYSHSRIESVEIVKRSERALSLYPNPTEGRLIVETTDNELMDVKIHDIFGRDCQHLVKVVDREATKVIFDLKDLHVGLYFIKTGDAVYKVYKQ